MKVTIDEEFKAVVENIESGKYKTPLELPEKVWNSKGWELIGKKKFEELMLPFLNWQIKRAKRHMPDLYSKAYDEKKIDKIDEISDFWEVPGLIKDSKRGNIGIRHKVKINPKVMLPKDVASPCFVYKSGGTRGVPTPTFITKKDREIESWGFARGFEYEGMERGDVALTTYNPTHKGGEEIKEGFEKVGMMAILRRTTDSAKETIETMESYGVNVLLTVQGPVNEHESQQKGPGINLLSLIEHGQETLEKLKVLFLGGYKLIPEALAWSEAHNIPLVTLLGSSEAIPQATNTNFGPKDRTCVGNNLHVLNGPHYIEVLKEESGILVPVKKNEEGILAYTTIAREGTIYMRYLPGDSAKIIKNEGECSCGLKTDIITDVSRIDIPEDVLQTGCCIG